MSGTTENRSSVLPQVTLVLVCVTTFMLLLDTTVVNLALADLQNSLGVTLAQLQWVIDAYLLTLGTFLLLSGAAGDRFGQNRLFVIGLIIFTAGSLGCSISPNVALLVVARGVQGVGGALLLGLGLPMLRHTFRGAQLNKAVGFFGASIGLATAVGPLVGGGLTNIFGWRAIFVLNVPIGIACLVWAARWLRGEQRSDREYRPLDIPGALTLGVALASLIFAFIRINIAGWTSADVMIAFVVFMMFLASGIYMERRRQYPLVPRELTNQMTFRIAALAAFLSNGLLVGASALLALYFQNTLEESPLTAGLRFLPLSVLAFLAGVFGGRPPFVSIPLKAQVVLSLTSTSLGLGTLVLTDESMPAAATMFSLALAGLGMGIGSVCLSRLALVLAAPSQAGVSAGVINTMRQIGASVGVAVFGAIFSHTATAQTNDLQLPAGAVEDRGLLAELSDRIASGEGLHALSGLPVDVQNQLRNFVGTASYRGLTSVLLCASVVGLVVAVATAVLLSRQNLSPQHDSAHTASDANEYESG